MKKIQNENRTDRILRVIFGLGIFLISMDLTSGVKIVMEVISAILVVTGITGFCAIYKILGINTLKK